MFPYILTKLSEIKNFWLSIENLLTNFCGNDNPKKHLSAFLDLLDCILSIQNKSQMTDICKKMMEVGVKLEYNSFHTELRKKIPTISKQYYYSGFKQKLQFFYLHPNLYSLFFTSIEHWNSAFHKKIQHNIFNFRPEKYLYSYFDKEFASNRFSGSTEVFFE